VPQARALFALTPAANRFKLGAEAKSTRDDPRNYLVVPPDSWLIGLKQGDSYIPFQTQQLLSIMCSGYPADVELVSPATLTAVSGRTPEPLDPHSGYRGWRLP